MNYVFTQPDSLVAATAEMQGIGAVIKDATAAAADPTTKLMTMAADEVSAAVTSLFSEHAQLYQELSNQAAVFHDEFVRSLSAAANAYASAEGANTALARQAVSAAAAPVADTVALVMGPSYVTIPSASYLNSVKDLFIQFLNPGAIIKALNMPNNLYPTSGPKNLTFDKSVAQGVTILEDAIKQQIAAGNDIVVFGYSQSASVASTVMSNLAALPIGQQPGPGQLSFILAGNPNNPNGGLFTRFPGGSLSGIGMTFTPPTPDNLYPTTVFTREYDAYADFPRYPINLIADLNAVAGVYYLHSGYAQLTDAGFYSLPPTAAEISSAIQLPTQGPTNTTYYIIPSPHLPLLEPLRALPVLGNPLANLIEPNLRVIVNLGYGDPAYGYSTGPANVATPFGLFPHVPPSTIFDALVAGTHQGVSQFSSDMTALSSVPLSNMSGGTGFDPGAALSSFATSAADAVKHFDAASLLSATSLRSMAHGAIDYLQTANTAISTFNATINANHASILLPMADMALTLGVSLPSYNVNLFLGGIQTALAGNPFGLVEAIGLPIAADMGLVPLALLLGGETILYYGILADVQAISDLVAAL
jgi:hypothetical protein